MWEDDDENHGMVCPKTMGWLNCLYVTDRLNIWLKDIDVSRCKPTCWQAPAGCL